MRLLLALPLLWLSWVYDLSDYANDNLQEVASACYDLAVIDLAGADSSDYFTLEEIQEVQATGKTVLAYFEIGAIEDYRPEWDSVPDDIKLGAVDGWNSEQYVAYWDERWWTVVQGRVDQALDAGFDGAYLDMIVTYEELPAGSAGTNRNDLAQKMVDLIARLSIYAKQQDPDFLVFPQNSPELHAFPGYLNAIDGLGMEEMYVRATNRLCTLSWCYENIANAKAVLNAGKTVLSIDYATTPEMIDHATASSLADGFIPFTSVRNLNIVPSNCTNSVVIVKLSDETRLVVVYVLIVILVCVLNKKK